MAETTRRLSGEFVRGGFKLLLPRSDGLAAKSTREELAEIVLPAEFEKTTYPRRQEVRRYGRIVRFSTTSPAKAGWSMKNKGLWALTGAGRTPYHRVRRDRRVLAEETSKRKIEVPLGQAVQVELRQEVIHFRGATRQPRQEPTLEPLLQPSNTRTWLRHRPAAQRQLPRLPVLVPLTRCRVHRPPTNPLPSSEQPVPRSFQHPPQPAVHLDSQATLEVSPRGDGRRGSFGVPLLQGRCPPSGPSVVLGVLLRAEGYSAFVPLHTSRGCLPRAP